MQSMKLPKIYDNAKNQVFGDGFIRVDRIKTNNQELIINNPSKQVQPIDVFSKLIKFNANCHLAYHAFLCTIFNTLQTHLLRWFCGIVLAS